MSSLNRQESTPFAIGFHEALGTMMWLMKHADYHSQWPLWSVDQDVVPALVYGQYKLYFDEHYNPVGFASWAWLDKDSKQQVLANKIPLQVEQWNGGKHLMFGDFIAPWGHAKFILRDLRTQVFPEYKAFSLGRHQDGSIRKVYHWKGSLFTDGVTSEQRSINKKLWAQTG